MFGVFVFDDVYVLMVVLCVCIGVCYVLVSYGVEGVVVWNVEGWCVVWVVVLLLL